MNIESWKRRKKELKWTHDDLARESGVARRTIAGIFSGDPRYASPTKNTMEAIERALGLSEWSADEKAEGVGEHAVNLSADEWEWLELRSEVLEVGGQEMLATIIELLRTMIKTNKKK